MIRGLAILLALAGPALAHSWYPYECCHERDCAPVKPGRWRSVQGGWQIVIHPGEHPMAGDAPRSYFVAFKDARPSPDKQFHLCLNLAREVLCAFAPSGDV